MQNKNQTQLGYFIGLSLWRDALKLLEFQLQQKKKNRHFNTLSMFYYEGLDTKCLNEHSEYYFNIKISSNLFYGLKKEFCVIPYVIPKTGLGLRDYKFFTYPMRALYYTIGLYLLRLSQEFLTETYKKVGSISAFYGGNLTYESDDIQLSPKNTYYRHFYKEFKVEVEEEIELDSQKKVVIRLDIANYFNEISIPKLLNLLNRFIKPSVQASMKYDAFTQEQIACIFQFISTGDGIPQAENDIISSFVGYLYLVFGDLFIDDLLNSYQSVLESHKIIRYVDDIYISLLFKEDVPKKSQSSSIYEISSQVSELLYRELGLKLNTKTKLSHLSDEEEKKELIETVREVSHIDGYFPDKKDDVAYKLDTDPIQEGVDKMFEELLKIKNSRIEDYFEGGNSAQQDILRQVFDEKTYNVLSEPTNRDRLRLLFKDFDFDLVKVQPLAILIILLKDETAKKRFRIFCLSKPVVTIFDIDLIIKFLCQTKFEDQKLIDKLHENSHMSAIADLLTERRIYCETPGYYGLFCLQMKKMSEMPDVLEQTRLRILSERRFFYSVALNHLVNEIHAICIKLEGADKKKYDVKDVVKYLRQNGVNHETCIKIRNMFDRRNSNSVSHPGDGINVAWGVTRQEYFDYSRHVGLCLESLL